MILSVDPGKATGMTLFSIERGEEPVLIWAGEYQQEEYAKPIRDTLVEYPDVLVVCERFIINAQTAKKTQAPYSLEQIGILKQCLMDAGRNADDIIFQSPSDATSEAPIQAFLVPNLFLTASTSAWLVNVARWPCRGPRVRPTAARRAASQLIEPSMYSNQRVI